MKEHVLNVDGAYAAIITSSLPVSDQMVGTVWSSMIGHVTGVMEPRRISANAVEISFVAGASPPDTRRPDGPYDLNIIAQANRHKSVLIADMDSTIIDVECIDELADFAGVKSRVAEITERAMSGNLDFEAALDARVGLLAGLSEEALQTCYDTRINLNPGARCLVTRMNAAGGRTALVSGGFTFFSERVAKAAGFQSHQANILKVKDGKLTGTVAKPVLGQAAKAEALYRICHEQGVSAADVVAIGDGANDLAMIRVAGLGVAYKAKPALRNEADIILDHSDLSALAAILRL